jgi:iron complex transport system permease protein
MSAAATSAWDAWRAHRGRRTAVLAAALAAVAATAIADIATGPALLPVRAVVLSVIGLGDLGMIDTIVWTLRLPMAAMAVCAGAALGVSGGVMQTILNNPLASSYTLGISAASGFGAALAIVAGAAIPVPEHILVPLAAFAFACIGSGLVYGIGALRGATVETLVLAGIALMFMFQALLSLVQLLAAPEALQQVVFWLFGSLQRASWGKVAMVAAVLALAAPMLARDAWRLTALKLGDERARALGVDVGALRLRAFLFISLATGVSVAFCGTIGFVGLVAPHLARTAIGEDQRFMLPGSAIAGALLLSAASVASKTVSPGALFPIGIVTALVGVPFFAWLILAQRRTP